MEEFLVISLILGVIALILWIYAIYDIVRGTFQGSGSKFLWLIVVIIFPILGAILYLLSGRKSKTSYHSGAKTSGRY